MLFATATQWVARLGDAKRQGSLETELKRLSFVPLLVVDLCRYRDNADMAATAVLSGPWLMGFAPVPPTGVSAESQAPVLAVGNFMATTGETTWPPVGRTDGRTWGEPDGH